MRNHGACATFGASCWEGPGLHPSPLSLAGIRLIGLILAIGHLPDPISWNSTHNPGGIIQYWK